MKKIYLSLFLLFALLNIQSQVVTRGPYMQSQTSSTNIVIWETNIATTSKVWYGLSPNNLSDSLTFGGSITKHSFEITGLQPYTKYFYAVGYGNTVLAGADSMHYFITAPLPYTEQPIRVWATGDFGKGNQKQIDTKVSFENYTRNQQIDPDIWLWLGDNAYQNGEQTEYQNNVFGLNGYKDIFSWLPFWPSPGNHDYGEIWSNNGTLGIPYTMTDINDHDGPYFDIVDVPEQAEAGGVATNHEVFYSYDYGNAHFLSLNSEVYAISSNSVLNQMRNWIQDDLSQNDKDWVIAYWHQPPYSKGSHDSDDFYEDVMKDMREKVIPVLEQFDIDLVICGHSHVYERSYLMHGHYDYSNTFNPSTMVLDFSDGNKASGNAYIKNTFDSSPQGTVYTVVGNSGSDNDDGTMDHPAMIKNLNGSGVCGSLVIDIYKNELNAKFLTTAGTIFDDYSIIKQNMLVDAGMDLTICQYDSTSLSASTSKGSDSLAFNWMPGNLNTQSIEVSPSSTTSYYLKVTDLLSGQIARDTIVVTVAAIPASVSITETNGVLSTTTGYTYQWFRNGTSISGANSASFTPTFQDTYTVQVSNSQGCLVTSPPFYFYDLEIDASASATELCEGDSVIINISSNGGSDSTEVFWLTPSGSNLNTYYSPSATEDVIAQGNDYLTGEVETDTISLIVNPNPIEPTITQNNQILSTSFDSNLNYTWYFNGTIINGNFSNEITATQSGTYTVKVTDANGCEAYSESFQFTSVGITNQISKREDLIIYPNPNKGSFTIKTNEKIIQINVYDVKGQKVYSSKNNSKSVVLKNLSDGNYILEVETEKANYKQNFIIQH